MSKNRELKNLEKSVYTYDERVKRIKEFEEAQRKAASSGKT